MDLSEAETGYPEGGEEEADAITKICVLGGFSESRETRTLIGSLPEIHEDDRAGEFAVQKFRVIMDRYQDQPHLLDPHLEWVTNMLLNFIRNENSPSSLFHLSFQFLYVICKVRGYKVFMQLFPHEVSDFHPVLEMISRQDPTDLKTWETRYMLLLWLSMTCLIPFDLSRLDGHLESQGVRIKEPVMERILTVAKTYLLAMGSPRDAAPVLVSKFMTRPDVKQKHLGGFLDWSLTSISQSSGDSMIEIRKLDGVLQSLAKLLKHGKRDDFLQYAPIVLRNLEEKRLSESSEAMLRKIYIKIIQRLGLTFLKPRLAAWRYERGSRSLAANLSVSHTAAAVTAAVTPETETREQEEDYDIPEEVETVIEHLLVGLKDKETVVRWSAAKGIGRVTGRLPKELADDVVGSVLDCFSFQETDNAWHGGCLALAELGRRGLLLPSRLTDVVPLIMKALTYDEKRGACSVGSNVRDAACYVCWSFSRAYEPKELQPFVTQIASALLITAVFDRNINCRRAASAAFQENVGRQGTFPHGIDIVTAADYFAVGMINNCYLNISVFIAGFPEYTKSMIEHLISRKINHWDGAIRLLATKALHNLTPQAPDYMATTVLPQLLTLAVGVDLHSRHGAILACGEITYALYKVALQSNRTVMDLISPECVDALKNIHNVLHERKQYRGFGGALMRPAICSLIEKLSLSKMPIKNDPIITAWQSLIDDTIKNLHLFSSGAKEDFIVSVVTALSALSEEFYQDQENKADTQIQDALISQYLEGLKSPQLLTRCGSARALGCLPRFMIQSKLKQIFGGLEQMCTVSQKEGNFTEARRDAVRSVAQVFLKAGVCPHGSPDSVLCSENVVEVFDFLLCSINDYTTDSRGDIGAWVRKSAMTSLQEITLMVSSSAPEILSPHLVKSMMCCLAQQAAEQNDHYRAHAGNIFLQLLHSTEPVVPHIPHKEELLSIFPVETITSLNWNAPSQAFKYITQLLGLLEYQYHTLLGLSASVGGITESTANHSSQSLFAFLKGIQKDIDALTQFTQTLLRIFKNNLQNDRVSVPLLMMLSRMLANNFFEILTTQENHQVCVDLLGLCKELRKSRNVAKIRACIYVYCGLIQFEGDVRKKVLSQLLMLLCHAFPIIRKTTSAEMYEMLLTYNDVADPDVLEDVLNLLSDTQWESDLDTVRERRNQLCDWLGVPRPRPITKGPAQVS
ncbi:tubulin-specific chaperone D [Gambusia affinis]|uniref:tubulin-specific chaperone D n=1 Tax=Gambusia affinis TaxID=33528 RepID=UPI001CDBB37F|nr:tubulin-specific chaperone D [Gambusia affinis]